ncbi:hypothetical protein FE257_007887 [Aspergillus nanangensis]|uniref:FAS1 domain-containing protein n=1 Tax=Aspergillus nanangensis TaxID=2582783 RepID=A0AAD4CX79_ASPNN|nr:hypothetical protein FE257_007887 [Aspergillus nanangensis]
MRALLYTSILLVFSLTAVLAWDIPAFTTLRKRLPRPFIEDPQRHHSQRSLSENTKLQEWLHNQQPLMGKIFSKPAPMQDAKQDAGASSADHPVISDVLPRTRGINIYASLTRDFESVESRLNDSMHNITVLAPRNSAIQALPRKPWENPDDYARFGEAAAYEGEDGEDRAKKNLKRFVEAHIVAASPWKEGEEVDTLAGEKLRWEKHGEKIYIQPGNIEVDSIAEKVSNGEVWVLNQVVNYR